MNQAKKIQRKIMGRIYRAFAVRVVTHQVTVQVALFVLALYVFKELVHVQRIVETLLNTPLGHMPTYISNALLHGEVLVLIAIGVMVFVGLSLPMQIRRGHSSRQAHFA